MTSRREFLARIAGGGSAALLLAARSDAQQGRRVMHDSTIARDTSNLFTMDQSAAQPVRLPPKPGAVPLLTNDQRDDLEHRIHCQCSCTLDIYTCRTTDFSCQVSPAMHRDVVELVRGGYSAQEIIDAFVGVYGERALMAPTKSGFNLLGWFAPGTAVVIGAGILVVMLRRWGSQRRPPESKTGGSAMYGDATPDELARLDAAVKGDRDE